MAIPQVQLSNSFDEWRVITNTLATNAGDLALIYDPLLTNHITALNDLETRKFNKAGGTITGNTNIVGTFGASLAVSFGSTLGVTGDLSVNTNKFVVVASSGNTTVAGTLGVTGISTLGVLNSSDFTVGSNKFTVVASSGNTAVAGTLAVSGVSTMAAVSATSFSASLASTFGSTLGVTSDFSVNTNKFVVTATSGNTAIAGTITVVGQTNLAGSIVSTLGTVAANTPILNATQTWNNAGVVFSGIKVNVTNTASASRSLLLDFQLGGVDKFGVDVNGAIFQQLAGTYLSRYIKSGFRAVREYQDLTDDGVQGLPGSPGISTDSFEWGFTWNAGWNSGTSTYVKDRSNASDHAFMFRLHKKYGNQWWFSDGTTPGSAISWVKKVDFDLSNSTYTFNGSMTVGTINTNNLVTTGSVTTGSVTTFADYSVTTATVASTPLATINGTAFRSATFEIQAFDATSGKYHKTLVSAIHNGATADFVEYGSAAVNGVCGAFNVVYSGGSLILSVASVSANSTVYKVHTRLMAM